MGRLSLGRRLEAETRGIVDRCIRANQYQDLLGIVAELAGQGITIPRSTLHRYVTALREADALCALPDEGTIVTIVERGTGQVRVVKTAATGLAVAALIEKTGRPDSFS